VDYCNSLYFGITNALMSRLQSTPPHVSSPESSGASTSRQLHWLPVHRRVDFKISTRVYRSLAGTAPVYVADECTLVTAAGRRLLRSADNRTCLVKRSRNQFGDRCFATAGPTLWNSLPEQLRQPDISFGKRSLKTFVWLVGRGALCLNVKGAD